MGSIGSSLIGSIIPCFWVAALAAPSSRGPPSGAPALRLRSRRPPMGRTVLLVALSLLLRLSPGDATWREPMRTRGAFSSAAPGADSSTCAFFPSGASAVPSGALPAVCKQSGPATVTVSRASANKKSWKGWGTSLCWWANFVGGLPDAQLNQLLDLIFSPTSGMGLNIVRYNIGGGYNPSLSPQLVGSFRGMPGFKATEGGGYDWTADGNQRKVLFGARSRGVSTFVAFSNSPPWWMTVSGDVAGSSTNGNNLKSTYYQAFANYLADIVQQYAKDPSWNLTFQHVVPVNEPAQSWWRKGGGQEGCAFSVSNMGKLYPLLTSALKARGLASVASGFDEWPDKTPSIVRNIAATALSPIQVLSIHGYIQTGNTVGAAEETQYANVKSLAQSYKKEVWMSEWGPVAGPGGNFGVAMSMANSIISAVNYGGVSAWMLWQAVDPYSDWSSVFVRNWDYSSPCQYSTQKAFFVMQQFTRNARPGATTIVPSSASDCRHGVTAFYNPGAPATVSVFIMNAESSDRTLTFNLKDLAPAVSTNVTVQVFRTSVLEDFMALPSFVWNSSRVLVYIAAGQSLTTLVIPSLGTS